MNESKCWPYAPRRLHPSLWASGSSGLSQCVIESVMYMPHNPTKKIALSHLETGGPPSSAPSRRRRAMSVPKHRLATAKKICTE